jgi:hypothetical protein
VTHVLNYEPLAKEGRLRSRQPFDDSETKNPSVVSAAQHEGQESINRRGLAAPSNARRALLGGYIPGLCFADGGRGGVHVA